MVIIRKKYFVLFQDTNVLAFNCIPSALGASVKLSLDINSICVPRRPKDAVGAICKLKKVMEVSLLIMLNIIN